MENNRLDLSSIDKTFSMSKQIMMDENARRIKEIVKPYEDKIKQQEKTIRETTFKIVYLKEQ